MFGQINNLVEQASNVRRADARQRLLRASTGEPLRQRHPVRGRRRHRTHGERQVLRRVDFDPQRLLTYCHVETPFSAQTQIKLFGSYPLPYDFMVSGVLQNLSGPQILANYAATNAEIAPSLGRNLAACPTDDGGVHGDGDRAARRAADHVRGSPHAARLRVSRRFRFGSQVQLRRRASTSTT